LTSPSTAKLSSTPLCFLKIDQLVSPLHRIMSQLFQQR
jgi:hypothetical protein